MELTQLLQRRLKISLNAANNDPTNSESLKSVLAVFFQILSHQSTTIEIIESQLNGKTTDIQFKKALSNKLSVKQFLGYFQKVEKVVEKMENYWSGTQNKNNEQLAKYGEQLKSFLEEELQQRIQQFEASMSLYQSKLRQLQENQKKINTQIEEIRKDNKKFIDNFEHKISQKMKSDNALPQQKLKIVLTEMREIQEYLNATHEEIKELLQSMITNKPEKKLCHQTTTQKKPQNQINLMLNRLDQLENFISNRWIWEWSPQFDRFRWEKCSGFQNLPIEGVNESCSGFNVPKEGLYKLTVGYLVDQELTGHLELLYGSQVLFRVDLEGQGIEGLCRTTMLYAWLRQGVKICLKKASKCFLRGFLELQGFSNF